MKIKKEMLILKVKLFTHTDLDGVGCAIIGKLAFDDIDIEYCNYDEIDNKVRDFTGRMKYKHYDKVFITDISVNRDVADLIEYSITEKREYLNKYQLIDHHATAKWLNEYEWANVTDYYNEEMKTCGTSLFYDFLHNEDLDTPHLIAFIEAIRRYDTWEWNTRYNDLHAKELNDLLYIMGREKFFNRFIQTPNVNFDVGERMLLEIERDKIEAYIESKKKQMFEDELDGYKVGVVFNEQYHSQLGNELAVSNPHLDFIVMINAGNGTVSYRGIHKHINIGEIVKKYGGGGHPQAAGSQTKDHIKQEVWQDFIINPLQ